MNVSLEAGHTQPWQQVLKPNSFRMGHFHHHTYPASLLHHMSGEAFRNPTVLQSFINVNALPSLLEEKIAETIILGQRHGWKASNFLQSFPS